MIRAWCRIRSSFWSALSHACWCQALRAKHARALKQAQRFRELARLCTCKQIRADREARIA